MIILHLNPPINKVEEVVFWVGEAIGFNFTKGSCAPCAYFTYPDPIYYDQAVLEAHIPIDSAVTFS